MNPNQFGFIPKRSIHENIVVAQEILHNMHIANIKMGSFSIKSDLAKAYDNISWNFISNVLSKVDVSGKLKDLIMIAITSVKMMVLWKGYFFEAKKGLRQGDPLSP